MISYRLSALGPLAQGQQRSRMAPIIFCLSTLTHRIRSDPRLSSKSRATDQPRYRHLYPDLWIDYWHQWFPSAHRRSRCKTEHRNATPIALRASLPAVRAYLPLSAGRPQRSAQPSHCRGRSTRCSRHLWFQREFAEPTRGVRHTRKPVFLARKLARSNQQGRLKRVLSNQGGDSGILRRGPARPQPTPGMGQSS
jgi:hypothetical protein